MNLSHETSSADVNMLIPTTGVNRSCCCKRSVTHSKASKPERPRSTTLVSENIANEILSFSRAENVHMLRTLTVPEVKSILVILQFLQI